MNAEALFSHWVVEPFARWGFVGSYWQLNLDTLIYMWVAMFFLFATVAIVRWKFFEEESLIYTGIEMVIESFANMCADSIGYFRFDYFSFITTMFLFTFFGCIVGLLPYMDEATRDANTTFALGIASFMYMSYQQIYQEGVLKYLKHFLGHEEMPLPIRIVMTPLEVLGQFSKIISMGFRLFGNILGGAVVYHVLLGVLASQKIPFIIVAVGAGIVWVVVYRLIGVDDEEGWGRWLSSAIQILFAITWAQFFFGIFEALIQSFVIAMLSITYLSLAVHHDLAHDPRGKEWQT